MIKMKFNFTKILLKSLTPLLEKERGRGEVVFESTYDKALQ